MNTQQLILGELTCTVLDDLPADALPQLAVVLCHGYGAPGTDLVPIGEAIFRSYPHLRSKVRFLFPVAPFSLEELGMIDGRAWWHLDIMTLSQAIARGDLPEGSSELLQGMDYAREQLQGLIDAVQRKMELSFQQLVLGGFSQGAVICTDLTLHAQELPAALAIFSGTLVNETIWKQRSEEKPGLRVLQSHGTQDTVLPFSIAERLYHLLKTRSANIEFIRFTGEHTIPPEAFTQFVSLLNDLCQDPD